MATMDTHFEGISAVQGGFSIAATVQGYGTFISLFPWSTGISARSRDWAQVENSVSGASDTTGNTVIGTTVMGQFTLGNDHVSFQASVVPEPGSFTLLAVGMGLAWLIWRVKPVLGI